MAQSRVYALARGANDVGLWQHFVSPRAEWNKLAKRRVFFLLFLLPKVQSANMLAPNLFFLCDGVAPQACFAQQSKHFLTLARIYALFF